ncbi:MAG TPA: TRAP transporter small permease [Pseudolabrys sp.]|jgi:TRAP-type C4-dicarboxylate transport system permease small subunit|nr:TRAP transporter small permease [Pseudolabrys sp.]
MTDESDALRHAEGGMAQDASGGNHMPAAWRAFSRAVKAINAFTGIIGGLLIVASCVVITNEVIWRYYLRHPHTWNLELNIFLLIGATFLAANYTQMRRGHVGTEVLQTIMPASWNRWRIFAGDVLSLLLCAFLTVIIWRYTWQAWSEGWTTDSVWAPPLWIPYSLMSLGLTLISLEYLVQLVEELAGKKDKEQHELT